MGKFVANWLFLGLIGLGMIMAEQFYKVGYEDFSIDLRVVGIIVLAGPVSLGAGLSTTMRDPIKTEMEQPVVH